MHRRALLALTLIAGLIGGFHEWTPPAHAAAFCTTWTQFPNTFAGENTDGTFIVGVTGQAEFSCSSQWRVTFVPLYQDTGESVWHVGFDNTLIFPLGTGTYAATQQKVFLPPNTPSAFTGYWTPGDGLRASRPVCAHSWRLRERFTNSVGTLVGTDYSPTITPTC